MHLWSSQQRSPLDVYQPLTGAVHVHSLTRSDESEHLPILESSLPSISILRSSSLLASIEATLLGTICLRGTYLPAKMDVDPRSAAGLTPPASDESDKKDDSGSELSDLEEPSGEIEPDHYWDNGSIPVFKPVRYFSLHSFPCALQKYLQ